MSEPKKKLNRKNPGVCALFTWIKINLYEWENRHQINKIIMEHQMAAKGYTEDVLLEIQKDIDPLISVNGEKLLLGDDLKKKRQQIKKQTEKRDIDLITIGLNYFKGIREYININKLIPDEIRKISRYVKYKFCPKNSFIFREGENPEFFYVIIKGKVQVIERKFLDRTQEIKQILVNEENINNKNKRKISNASSSEESSDEEKVFDKKKYEDLSLEAYWRRKESLFLKKERQRRKKIKKFLDRYNPEKIQFKLSSSSSKKNNDDLDYDYNDIFNENITKKDEITNKNFANFNENNILKKDIEEFNKKLKSPLKMKIKTKIEKKIAEKILKIKIYKPIRSKSTKICNNFLRTYDNIVTGNIIDYKIDKKLKLILSLYKDDDDINEKYKKICKKKSVDYSYDFQQIKKKIFQPTIKYKLLTTENKNQIKYKLQTNNVIRRNFHYNTTKISTKFFKYSQVLYDLLLEKNTIKTKNKSFNKDNSKLNIKNDFKNYKNSYLKSKRGKAVFELIKQLQSFNKELKDEDFFGDEALRYNTLEEYSTYCLTDTHLITLHKDYYNKFLLEKVKKTDKHMKNFILSKFPLLRDEPKYISLASKMRPHNLQRGEYIYTPFDDATDLYLIYDGECSIARPYHDFNSKNELLLEKPKLKIISSLSSGGFAGLESCVNDRSLIGKVKYENCLVVTNTDATIFKIPIKDFMDRNGKFLKCIHAIRKQKKNMTESVLNNFKFLMELRDNFEKKNENKDYEKSKLNKMLNIDVLENGNNNFNKKHCKRLSTEIKHPIKFSMDNDIIPNTTSNNKTNKINKTDFKNSEEKKVAVINQKLNSIASFPRYNIKHKTNTPLPKVNKNLIGSIKKEKVNDIITGIKKFENFFPRGFFGKNSVDNKNSKGYLKNQKIVVDNEGMEKIREGINNENNIKKCATLKKKSRNYFKQHNDTVNNNIISNAIHNVVISRERNDSNKPYKGIQTINILNSVNSINNVNNDSNEIDVIKSSKTFKNIKKGFALTFKNLHYKGFNSGEFTLPLVSGLISDNKK